MWRVIVNSSVVSLGLLSTGCTSLIASIQDTPTADLQLNVPIVLQQDSKQCGVAVLTMVSSYYNKKLPNAELQDLVALADKQNSLSGANLVQALKRSGYFVALFSGTMDETPTGLRYNISRGRPLIVMLQHEIDAIKFQHYVVLMGYYDKSGDWLIADPQLGKRFIKAKTFMKDWAATGFFTLLTMPESNNQTSLQ